MKGSVSQMIDFCSLFSGSSGNCIFVATANTKLLIDAGVSGSKITNAMQQIGENPEELAGILITHEHIDHVRAAGILCRKYGTPIYCNQATWEAMQGSIGKVPDQKIMLFDTYEEFAIGDLYIRAFDIPHDAAEPVGFNIYKKTASEDKIEKVVTIATDLGHISGELLENLKGSSLILLESNHDVEMLKVGPYPYELKKRIQSDVGHLSNDGASDVVTYLFERGTKRFVLGHLSKENNYPELALLTTENKLKQKNICNGKDVLIEIASRSKPGRVISV